MDKQQYWFPAKRFGWGWGAPQTWQGWVAIVVWFTVFFGGVIVLGLRAYPLAHALWVAAMALALLVVCWWKGEPPRWRSGSD